MEIEVLMARLLLTVFAASVILAALCFFMAAFFDFMGDAWRGLFFVERFYDEQVRKHHLLDSNDNLISTIEGDLVLKAVSRFGFHTVEIMHLEEYFRGDVFYAIVSYNVPRWLGFFTDVRCYRIGNEYKISKHMTWMLENRIEFRSGKKISVRNTSKTFKWRE